MIENATLTPSRRTILEVLVSQDTARITTLIDALWGHDPNGGPDDPHNVLRVQVLALRRFLARFDVVVETARGIGYRIPSQEMRTKARSAMDAGAEERWTTPHRAREAQPVAA